MNHSLSIWLDLFVHFASLSLLAIGGAITALPEMHRYLVHQNGWLTDAQFSSSIALSQAAPGPNVMFVAVLGWNVGLNISGGPTAGLIAWSTASLGALVMLVAILLPSSLLTYSATNWVHRNRGMRSVRAFKAGMSPIVVALLISTGWLLVSSNNQPSRDWPLWLMTLFVVVIAWRTKIHLLWMMGAGAALGALGLI